MSCDKCESVYEVRLEIQHLKRDQPDFGVAREQTKVNDATHRLVAVLGEISHLRDRLATLKKDAIDLRSLLE